MDSANIRPDDGGDDVLDLEEGLESLSSEILKCQYKNGRYYSIQPDDIEDEYPQVDVGQHIFGLIYNGELSLAPTSSLGRVLDVGAGSGKWALDMGVMYPDATVTGVDLSPIQPSWVPENVNFHVDDVNEEWSFDNQFDLIHVQQMAGSINDWAYLSGQAIKYLNPGGYLEIHDFTFQTTSDDNTLPEDSNIVELNRYVKESFATIGKDPTPHYNIREQLERAGFEDIQEKRFFVPINTWPAGQDASELGKFRNMQYREYVGTSLRLLTRILRWTQEDARFLLDSVQAEVNNRRVHAYDVVSVFTAKKPDTY